MSSNSYANTVYVNQQLAYFDGRVQYWELSR